METEMLDDTMIPDEAPAAEPTDDEALPDEVGGDAPDETPDDAETAEGEDSDEPGETDEAAADDETAELAEVVVNGKTYQVHPDLKEGYIQQADYTRKTQEVAEQRRAVETREEQLREAAQVQLNHIHELADIRAAQSVLEQFEAVDWDRLWAENPDYAGQLSHQQQQAVQAKQAAERKFSESRNAAIQKQQAELAKAQEKCRETVAREIPGWTAERQAAVVEYALELGFTEQALRGITNPMHVKLLNDAYLYRQAQNKQRKAKPKPDKVETSKAVKPKKAPPKTGLHDSLSTDEWLRRREKQLAA